MNFISGSVAAGSEQRLNFNDREPKTSLKLFVYIISVEHCPLLAESDRFDPEQLLANDTASHIQTSR